MKPQQIENNELLQNYFINQFYYNISKHKNKDIIKIDLKNSSNDTIWGIKEFLNKKIVKVPLVEELYYFIGCKFDLGFYNYDYLYNI